MSTSEKSAAKGAAKTEDERERLVYVGPTLLQHQAIHARVYIGDLPEKVQAAIENYKWFANLFVRFEDLSEAQLSIRQRSGAWGEAYKLAMELAARKEES